MGRSFCDGFVVVFVFFLLSFQTAQLCLCENLPEGCIEQEKQALLKFRDSFDNYSSSHYLTSWEGTDCCKWKGVRCDGGTGHVVKIDLSAKCNAFSESGPCSFPVSAKAVSTSLLELEYLNYLDLSFLNFRYSPIPFFFGSMKQLRYLNLSHCLFRGGVPHHLGNLTNLEVLDLSTFPSFLQTDDFNWLSQLSSLQYIDMSGVYIDQKNNSLLQVINKLPFLLQAHFMYCGIDFSRISHGFVNSTFSSMLQVLNLRGNYYSGPFPKALQNMTNIRVLDLSESNLYSVPLCLGEFKKLAHLDLSWNILSGVFPITLQNMSSSLRFLDLSYNSLTFIVPLWSVKGIQHVNLAHNKFSSLRNSPPRNSKNNDLQALDLSHNELNDDMAIFGQLKNLMYLSLASNSFYGPIPPSFKKLTNLRELIIADNKLNGTIPAFLGKFSSLRVLDLSGNHLNGIIPDSLGKLLNLKILDLSNNSLEGALEKIHLGNLPYLQDLRVGLNKISLKLSPNWLPPFQLENLQLQSCKIETQFPQWLQTQRKLITLDLSDTGIWGTFPQWFEQKDLIQLDLSNNKIRGPLPKNLHDMTPKLNGFSLKNNLINGSIPKSLCELQGLYYLDLSKNELSSNVPSCLGNINSIALIDLSSNELSGTISNRFCNRICSLQSLNLSNNSLHGELPLCLTYCNELAILDLGDNQLSGFIPPSIGEGLPSLRILRLRQNMFSGDIPLSLCQLLVLQILDLANNKLIGTIPHCIGNLTGMMLDPSLDKVYGDTIAPEADTATPAPAPLAIAPEADTTTPAPAPLAIAPGTPASAPPAPTPDFEEWDKEDVKQDMKGRELDFTRNLKFVVNMDLSNNRLVGVIPEVLTSLSRLVNLNLSHNYLSGTIPSKIGQLKYLESLDFSRNQLAGPIPTSMSALTSLSHLNLSYNNFSGPIPEGNQFSTLEDPSIYVGNSFLCGEPVLKKCHDNGKRKAPSVHYEDNLGDEDEKEKVLFYFVVALGFITGFWGAIGVLVFNKSLRHACFRFVEKVGDKIYVAAAIRIAKYKRMG